MQEDSFQLMHQIGMICSKSAIDSHYTLQITSNQDQVLILSSNLRQSVSVHKSQRYLEVK